MENGRCRNHGGASLAGPAHPNFRTGRHSKFLKNNLAERYTQAVSDPHLIALRDEVALVDVRIFELLEALGETGNTRLWKSVRQKFDAFKSAAGKGNEAVGEARLALQQLDGVISEGLTAAATWDELAERLDLRRKLIEAETKRQKDMHQMISVERVLALMGLLIDEVKKRVNDREVLAALSAQFRRLVAGGDRETPAT